MPARDRTFRDTVSFRVDAEDYQALERLCSEEDRIQADVMRRILREYLAKKGMRPQPPPRPKARK